MFLLLLHRNIPNLFAARLPLGTLHVQSHDVIAALAVLMNRMLLAAGLTIAEAPLPTRDLAARLVLERDQAAIHVEDLERPVGFEFAELRLQRHQPERDQFTGVAIHRMLPRKIPEGMRLAVRVVIVEDRP